MSSIGSYRFQKSASQTLTASAASSDTLTPPALALDGFGGLTAGTITVGPLVASSAKVRVRSDIGGAAGILVTTDRPGAAPRALPALNDTFSFDEDTGALRFDADGRADLAAAVQIVAPAGLAVAGGANGLVTVAAAGHSIGTVPVGAPGNFTHDIRVTRLDDPTTFLVARLNVPEATSSFARSSPVEVS